MRCTEIRGRLEDFELGFLEPAEARACEAHVRTCEACAGELEAVRDTLRVLEGLAAPMPRVTRTAPPPLARARRTALAAAAASVIFGAGWIASSQLRAQPSADDPRIAPLLATVAEQAKRIAELQEAQLREQQVAEALRSEIAERIDAQARREAAGAERESAQRREVALLERRMTGVAGELARCTASNAADRTRAVASEQLPSVAPASPVSAAPQAVVARMPDVAPAADVVVVPAERRPALAPLEVFGATYRFVSGMVRRRDARVDDSVLAFREELMRISNHEE